MKHRNVLQAVGVKLLLVFLSSAVLTLFNFQVASAQAANETWTNTGTISADWTNSDNWGGNTAPGNNSAGATANANVGTFNTAIGSNGYGTAATPIIIDNGLTIGGIAFTTAAGNYYIGNTAANSLYLSSGGTIQIAAGLISTNAIEIINTPIVLEGAAYTFANNTLTGTGVGSGTLNFGGTITSGATTGTTTLTLAGTSSNLNTIGGNISNGTGTNVVAINVSNSGNLIMVPETWVFSGNNSYSGGTFLGGGGNNKVVLDVGSNNALGTGKVTFNGNGTLIFTGTNLTIGNALYVATNQAYIGGNSATITGGYSEAGSFSINNQMANGNTLTFANGAVTIDSAAGTSNTLTINNNYGGTTQTTFIGSVIQDWTGAGTGHGNLLITNAGGGNPFVILTGANTYTGSTTITGSTTQVGNGGTVAGSGPLSTTSSIINNNLLYFDTTSNQTISAPISGTGALKELAGNTGTLTLTGTDTYTGITTVNQGTLLVNGTLVTSACNVLATVAGSTAVFGGTGTVGGVTVGGGASGTSSIIAPAGIGTMGTLTTGNVTAAANSAFDFDINSVTHTSDLLKVSGLLSLGSNLAMLNVSDLGNATLSAGTIFQVASFTMESGTFTGLADGADLAVGANLFQVNYGTLASNTGFVTLKSIAAVPEATTYLWDALCFNLIFFRLCLFPILHRLSLKFWLGH